MSDRSSAAPAPETAEQEPETARTWRFPSAYTVLAVVTLLVWILAFLIPPGQYAKNDAGQPIAGSYHRVPSPESFGDRLEDLLLSPVNGLYSIKDDKTGVASTTNDDASGGLYGAAAIFFFVLCIGAFISVVFATGALDRGINRLAFRFRTRAALLVAMIMTLFALLGTVEGFAEETLGFYGVIVPLMLALGYDRLTAVLAILTGAGVGVLTATVDPFSIGTASAAAHVAIGDGIVLRALMWVGLTAVTIAYTLRYGSRVRADPSRSLVGFLPGDREHASAALLEPARLTGRDRVVLSYVVAVFVLFIFAIIPWRQVIQGPGSGAYSWELSWGFPQLSALFLLACIPMAVLARLGEKKLTDTVIAGMGEFLGAGIVIVLARGVTVIMNNSKITDTVLHTMESAVAGAGRGTFAVLIYLVNIPLAFLIPSTSGHATLAMPILAPLGDFAHVSRPLVITAWSAASGWINLFAPTTAVVMGGLALARVSYAKYLRVLWPLLAVLLVLTCAILFVAAEAQ